MDAAEDTGDAVWAPESCTLPSAERPLRLEEFDRVFRTWVHAVQRPQPTRLVLHLDPGPGRLGTLRDLARRESACCAFFTFVVDDGEGLVLEVHVPEGHVEVLDGLTALALRLSGATFPPEGDPMPWLARRPAVHTD